MQLPILQMHINYSHQVWILSQLSSKVFLQTQILLKKKNIFAELCILQDQSYIQTNTAPKKGQICSFTKQVLLSPLKGKEKNV